MMAPSQKSVLTIFLEQRRKHPTDLVVKDGDKELSYEQLDSMSSRLAVKLAQSGVKQGTIVPLVTVSCYLMVVSILAIWKAGGVYVPLDRSQWPMTRIRDTIRRLGSELVIYTGEPLPLPEDIATLNVTESLAESNDDLVLPPEGSCCPDLACIIFTSGTTGLPKGVMLKHSSLSHFVSCPPFTYNVTSGDRVLLVLSVAFDACLATTLSVICNGGSLIIADGWNFQERVRQCTVFVGTPSILEALHPPTAPDDYPLLDRIVLGGEVPSNKLLETWNVLGRPLWVAYGPTEATCATLTGQIVMSKTTSKLDPRILGSPIDGATITVVDDDMEPIQDLDRVGELLISGPGVSLGYWGDEQKTNEVFISFCGRRTYRTGDYVKWVLDGSGRRTVYFCGRRDRVIKLRGFLVNIDAEIDSTILRVSPEIEGVYTFFINGRLYTAIRPSSIDVGALSAKLEHELPHYMLPNRFFRFDQFPTNAYAKIEVARLRGLVETQIASSNGRGGSYGTSNDFTTALFRGLHSVLGVPEGQVDHSATLISHGMHSLAAARMSAFMKARGYSISPQFFLTAVSIEQFIAQYGSLAAVAVKAPRIRGSPLQDNTTSIGPLVAQQARFIFGNVQQPHFNVVNCVMWCEQQALPRLKEAWHAVSQLEPIFRTVIETRKGQYIQRLTDEAEPMWSDKTIDPERLEEELVAIAAAVHLRSQFTILTVKGSSQAAVVWSINHALIDGLSATLIFTKVLQVLHGQDAKPSRPFPSAALQLQEYLHSQTDASVRYWKEQDRCFPDAVGQISNLKPQRPESTLTHAQYGLTIEDLLCDMTKQCTLLSVTPAALLYATWCLVLSAYVGSDTVIFGAVISGRNLGFDWSESMIGPLLDTLPFRAVIDRNMTAAQFLRKVHDAIQSISQYYGTSEHNGLDRCSTALSFDCDSFQLDHETMAPITSVDVKQHPNIPLVIRAGSDGSVTFIYQTAEFSSQDIRVMSNTFRSVLQTLLDPDRTIKKCLNDKFSPQDLETIRTHGNVFSPQSYANEQDSTVTALFDKVAAQHGSLAAVEKGGVQTTYSSLALDVNRLASVIEQFVQPKQIVCILADRSVNWVTGILAILKASAVYCPLDSSHPVEYWKQLIESSRASLVLCNDPTQMEALPSTSCPVLCIKQVLSSNSFIPPSKDSRFVDPSAPAFLVFTSGSTGQPKGILVKHRSIFAVQLNCEANMKGQPGRRIGQFLSPGFDTCFHEILSTLCFGGTLVLRKDADDPFSHLAEVDTATLTPSVASNLDPADYPNLENVGMTGEQLPQSVLDKWDSGRKNVYNIYGPAEATFFATTPHLKAGSQVNIGRPLPSTRAYILNEHLEIVPPGVTGYIFLAGIQVCQGYINNSVQQQREFFTDLYAKPWPKRQRMYRTGDLGCMDHEGNLHCFGRKDRQIKLRGFRLNLDYVAEAALKLGQGIARAAAIQRNGSLVLFVEPAKVDTEKVLSLLSTTLPTHMVPAHLVALEQLPLNRNEKIDFRRLETVTITHTAPKTRPTLSRIESLIAAEWRSLLRIDEAALISKSDKFSALGGHSILQLNLAARLRRKFEIPITVREVIQAPSLKALASVVEEQQRLNRSNTRPAKDGLETRPLGREALSPPEMDWWTRSQHSKQSSAFTVAYLAQLPPNIDLDKLRAAIKLAFERHAVLRSRFSTTTDGTPCRIISDEEISVELFGDDFDPRAFVNRPFQLTGSSLARVGMAPSVIAFSISHILIDYTGLRSLLNDIGEIYSVLPRMQLPRPRQYFEVRQWETHIDPRNVAFWRSYLGNSEVSRFKNQRKRSYRGTSLFSEIPHEIYQAVLHRTTEEGVTLHQFALSATSLLFFALGGRSDVVLGSPYINRALDEDQDVVGLFLEPLPICLRREGAELSCTEFLQRTKESAQSALAHAVPWPKLLGVFGIPFPSEHQQIFNSVVTFHDDRAGEPRLKIEGVKTLPVWPDGAKFKACFEFQALPDQLMFRLEYDTDILDTEDARILQNLTKTTIKALLHPDMTCKGVVQRIEEALRFDCCGLGTNADRLRRIVRDEFC